MDLSSAWPQVHWLSSTLRGRPECDKKNLFRRPAPPAHRGSLPEGAVEHEPFAGRSGKLVEHPTWAHILLEVGIRCMERSGDRAVLLALAWFTQVNQHHIRFPE